MLERAQMRMLPLANRTENVPIIPACCNVCRVCATNYIVGAITAAVAGLLALSGRLVRRLS